MSLNTAHKVTLTEGQISTILYTMEGYMQGSDDNEDSKFQQDVDDIFEICNNEINYWTAKKVAPGVLQIPLGAPGFLKR